MGFTNTHGKPGNDWVDFAVCFTVMFFVTLVLTSLGVFLGVDGTWSFTIAIILGGIAGLWSVSGKPEDFDPKFRAEQAKTRHSEPMT